jgi:hypothetical protein
MARTRGISERFHQDDGVLLGKNGQPLPVSPFVAKPSSGPVPLDRQGHYVSPAAGSLVRPRNMSGSLVLNGPGAEPLAPPMAVVGYRCAPDTWARDMDAYEVANLIDMMLKHPGDLTDGLTMRITVEEFNRLGGDLRRHFMAVRE